MEWIGYLSFSANGLKEISTLAKELGGFGMLATFITFWPGHPWAYCFASGALGGLCVCYGLNLKCPSQGHVQSACSLGVGWGMESLGGGNWLSK